MTHSLTLRATLVAPTPHNVIFSAFVEPCFAPSRGGGNGQAYLVVGSRRCLAVFDLMTLRLLWEVEGRFSCFAVAESEAATLGSSGQLAWIAAAGAPNGEPEDGETDVEVAGEADAAFGAAPGGAAGGDAAPLEHRVLLFSLQSPQPVRTFALGSRASSLCFADEGHDAGSSTNNGGGATTAATAATTVSEGRGRLLVVTDAAELLSLTEPLAVAAGSGSDAITYMDSDADAGARAQPRLALVPCPAAPALPGDLDLSFDAAASFSSTNQNSSDLRLGLGGFMPSDSAAAAVLAAPSSDLPSVSVACEAFLSALLGERLAGTGGDQDQSGESGSRYAAGAAGNVIDIEEDHDDDDDNDTSLSARRAGSKRGALATASAAGGPMAKRRPLGLTVDTTGKMYLAAPPRAQAEAHAQAQSEAWLVALEGALASLGPGPGPGPGPAARAPDVVAPLAPKSKSKPGKEKEGGGQDKASGGASVAPNPEPTRRSTRGK